MKVYNKRKNHKEYRKRVYLDVDPKVFDGKDELSADAIGIEGAIDGEVYRRAVNPRDNTKLLNGLYCSNKGNLIRIDGDQVYVVTKTIDLTGKAQYYRIWFDDMFLYVHAIVAMTWLMNYYKKDYVVHHINGSLVNTVENLFWLHPVHHGYIHGGVEVSYYKYRFLPIKKKLTDWYSMCDDLNVTADELKELLGGDSYIKLLSKKNKFYMISKPNEPLVRMIRLRNTGKKAR